MKVKNSSTCSDIEKFEVKCEGQDITESISYATVFQDVFFPTWTAELVVHDANNLIMNIPIIPGKKITIKIKTKVKSELDGEKTYNFVVSHVKDKHFQNWMNQTYTLVCIVDKMFENQGKRVSKAYIQRKPDDVVKDVLSNKLSISNVESDSCDNKVSVIIPNVSPFHVVSMMSKVAIKDGIADYLFFQVDDEKYKMKSFEKLYGEDSGHKFVMRINNLKDDKGADEEDYGLAFIEYQFIEHVDGLFTASSGLAASRLVEFDYIKKKWCTTDYKYSQEVGEDRSKKPWKDDLESPESNIMFMPKHPGLHETETVLDYTRQWESSRKNNLLKMELNKLIIQLPGGAKIWESLGKSCEVELPSQQDHSKEKKDKHFKGKYFIAAISHHISGQTYFINLELLKKRTTESFA